MDLRIALKQEWIGLVCSDISACGGGPGQQGRLGPPGSGGAGGAGRPDGGGEATAYQSQGWGRPRQVSSENVSVKLDTRASIHKET